MEWISVKDRLPPYNEEVLFVNGKNDVSVGRMMPYEPRVDLWASDDGIYFNDSIKIEWAVCKFWMPLPQSPREI